MFVECYVYVLKIGNFISISNLKGDTLSLSVTRSFVLYLQSCPPFFLHDQIIPSSTSSEIPCSNHLVISMDGGLILDRTARKAGEVQRYSWGSRGLKPACCGAGGDQENAPRSPAAFGCLPPALRDGYFFVVVYRKQRCKWIQTRILSRGFTYLPLVRLHSSDYCTFTWFC